MLDDVIYGTFGFGDCEKLQSIKSLGEYKLSIAHPFSKYKFSFLEYYLS